MKKIYVATKARGFLVNLFSSYFEEIEFIWEKNKIYEVNSKFKSWLSSIVRSKIGNYLGLIQRINVNNKNNFDIVFSYNRFLKVNRNYIIYLENPTALFHYSLGRNKTIVGKRKIQKYLNDEHLKAIVCISDACYNTMNNFYNIPVSIKQEQVYPLVPRNPYIDIETIKEKSHRDELKCLYISSDFKLKGGRDILKSFKMLHKHGIENISLKIITRISLLEKELLDELRNMKNVEICDFNYSKEDLNKIYSSSNILLNPTRQDSFSLVVLEAMKAGNAIISTDLYAIPEMVENDYNGYLINPKYRFFNYDNMPNEKVWNNRKKTIYSDYVDENIVEFLYYKIRYLNENRNQLEKLALNSFNKSTTGKLDEEYIKKQWVELINSI